MIKFIGLWSEPKDQEGFERHYKDVHMPLAEAVPGVGDIILTRADRGLGEDPPSFYRAVELYFASEADFQRAISSEEWGAVLADAGSLMERFGVSISAAVGAVENYRNG
jgi:uncharacterized protein (TIGR02118 family)